MRDSPCHYCPIHTVTCHATCKKYADYRKMKDKQLEASRYSPADEYLIERTKNRRNKAVKYMLRNNKKHYG